MLHVAGEFHLGSEIPLVAVYPDVSIPALIRLRRGGYGPKDPDPPPIHHHPGPEFSPQGGGKPSREVKMGWGSGQPSNVCAPHQAEPRVWVQVNSSQGKKKGERKTEKKNLKKSKKHKNLKVTPEKKKSKNRKTKEKLIEKYNRKNIINLAAL